MNNKNIQTACPTCQKKGTWNRDNSFRPFCSERCKLIDLGDWASEQHCIPDGPFHPPESDDKEP